MTDEIVAATLPTRFVHTRLLSSKSLGNQAASYRLGPRIGSCWQFCGLGDAERGSQEKGKGAKKGSVTAHCIVQFRIQSTAQKFAMNAAQLHDGSVRKVYYDSPTSAF